MNDIYLFFFDEGKDKSAISDFAKEFVLKKTQEKFNIPIDRIEYCKTENGKPYIKNYPDYIIGGEYIFEFVSDNPFEENIRTTAKILDLKENHKGETYVKYIIVDIPKKIQTKSIDDFAYYYKPI